MKCLISFLKNQTVIYFVSLLPLLCAHGENRFPQIPLMPARLNSYVREMSSAHHPRTLRSQTVSHSLALGLEAAVLGKASNARNEIFGLGLLYGARAFLDFPLASFTLRPSVGYFQKSEGVASFGYTLHGFEAGLGLYSDVIDSPDFRWHVGVDQRVDYLANSVSVLGTSEFGSAGYRYRVGPASGISFPVGDDLALGLGIEVTVVPQTPLTPYFGLTSGLIYNLK